MQMTQRSLGRATAGGKSSRPQEGREQLLRGLPFGGMVTEEGRGTEDTARRQQGKRSRGN